jgi:DNA-binding NarL/FixJ family response regulator
MRKIKLLIVDDHATLRDGLKTVINSEDNIEVIGEAENGSDAVIKAAFLRPDIILMDIGMPLMNGIEAARKIKKDYWFIKIIMLTMYDNKQFILDSLSAGIDGYILKMAKLDEVIKAINAVYVNDNYFDANVTEIIRDQKTVGWNKNYLGLTEREIEIINLILKGFTTPEIAKQLGISNHTAYNHRRKILAKLNVDSTASMIKLIIEKGIV